MKLSARFVALSLLLLPALAGAATPSVGVEQKLRRGLFVETDLGTYFDFRSAAPATVSNAQAYLQLGIGYDITERLSVALQFGLVASSGVCLADIANDGTCGVVDAAGNIAALPDNSGKQVLPDNFSNTFYQLHVSYRVPLVERLAFVPGAVVGYQKLDPAPLLSDNTDPDSQLSGGVVFGANLSLEYATHMDHFFVGLDVLPRFLVGPNLFSMAIFPRVKYTF
jgi:hypothetical protein